MLLARHLWLLSQAHACIALDSTGARNMPPSSLPFRLIRHGVDQNHFVRIVHMTIRSAVSE